VEVDIAKEVDEITSRYSRESGNLIPLLQEAQEKFGYLPEDVMQKLARFLKLPESTVYGVSTFYAQFRFAPTGKRRVSVCRGTACHVRGGARILREVEKRLGIKPGETTDDLEYSLETVACIGACALAPTMRIGKETYGQMTTKKVAEILGDRGKTG
jgi:NADH-quinone oxidoreductase subunit E